MWVMLTDAFFSIVAKDCRSDELLVRARRHGDIERYFPGYKVTRSDVSDYMFRTVVPTHVVQAVLHNAVEDIDYPNFKSAVRNRPLHDAYMRVWCTMLSLQPFGKRKKKGGVPRSLFDTRDLYR